MIIMTWKYKEMTFNLLSFLNQIIIEYLIKYNQNIISIYNQRFIKNYKPIERVSIKNSIKVGIYQIVNYNYIRKLIRIF